MKMIKAKPARKRSAVSVRKGLSLGVSVLAATVLCGSAFAQSSLNSSSHVYLNNIGTQGLFLDSHYVDGNAPISASAGGTFSGMDGAGNPQTMSWSGTAYGQADFGRLHVKTTGNLTNSYYSADNPYYLDTDGNILNPDGSPSTFSSLAFATFNDTLQFGGALEAGYQARYIFHVDGTNTGTGAVADLAFDVIGIGSEGFFDFDLGFSSKTWATNTYEINGITPQQIHVQFSNQVVFDLYDLTDGQDYSGLSDFSSTLTLAGIEVLNANGQSVSGWTVTSASGTVYNQILPGAQEVPEPGTLALFAGISTVGTGLYRRRRTSRA